jgi:hypothetical protein
MSDGGPRQNGNGVPNDPYGAAARRQADVHSRVGHKFTSEKKRRTAATTPRSATIASNTRGAAPVGGEKRS